MFDIKENLKKLPAKPGVYIMKNKVGEIIYIGKAVVLKNRVRQYFQNSANHTPKVKVMVSLISEFEYIVTDTEVEALILECNLIKQHRPKYNILLKDDKTYPYIKVTMQEEYPRILITRRIEKDGAKYFGPYTSSVAVKDTVNFLKKVFPIKTCKRVFPRDIGKDRPCLNYYINKCIGPCLGNVNKDKYRDLMKDICKFLNGRHEEIVKRLTVEMEKSAESMEYEKAAIIRDRINSIGHISQKQKVLSTEMENQDVIAFAKEEEKFCAQIFFVRGGKLIGRESIFTTVEYEQDEREVLAEVIKQFYSQDVFIPDEVIVQKEVEDIETIQKWLSNKRERKVVIRIPQKGEMARLVEMVGKNAHEALQIEKINFSESTDKNQYILKKLMASLNLSDIPKRIEAYDISNLGADDMVGGMVVFEDGKPNKSEYRRFKIKSQENQNDYGSMSEVIFRRFKKVEEEGKDTQKDIPKKFSNIPSLILLDGGLGHINAIRKTLESINVNIPIAGMVKDKKHRTRGLIYENKEIDIVNDMDLFRFITTVQNEVHRFALEYNKKLRDKRYKGSVLDEIEGIGAVRKKELIKHFGSIQNIKKAEVDDLESVKGINRSVAQKIYEHFRSN